MPFSMHEIQTAESSSSYMSDKQINQAKHWSSSGRLCNILISLKQSMTFPIFTTSPTGQVILFELVPSKRVLAPFVCVDIWDE